MQADDRLIVALDFPTMTEAKKVVTDLGDTVSYYKVGMELYYAAGSEIVKFLKDNKKHVFLDLKLQDIPNTVAKSLAVLTELGADIMNVHTVGGAKMMEEGVKSVKATATKLGIPIPKLIGVTVLTSMDDEQWGQLNYSKSINEEVVALAQLAKSCGLDGVVASPKEAAAIREVCGPEFLIVTPGVRPAGTSGNDQSRIATPATAIKNGATHLVVGRPITKAENKQAAVKNIVEEIRGVKND